MKIIVFLGLFIGIFSIVFAQNYRFDNFYSDIFNYHGSIMLIVNSDTGKIEDANNSAVKYYGYNKEVLLQMNISKINILSPEEIYTEMVKAKSQNRNHFYFVHRLADGTLRNVEVYSYPFLYKNENFLFSIINDVTERKIIETEREQMLTTLNEAEVLANIGHWTIDVNSNTTLFSTGVRLIYGLEDRIYSLQEIESVVLPKYRQKRRIAIDDLINNNIKYDILFEIKRPSDGKIRHIHSMAVIDTTNNRILGVLQDKTESILNQQKNRRNTLIIIFSIALFALVLMFFIIYLGKIIKRIKKTEEDLRIEKTKAEAASIAKSRFLTNMSHELRTPLNAIMGFSNLLADELQNPEHKEYINFVIVSSKNLLNIVNDVLDFSKIEADKLEISEDFHKISDTINEVISETRSLLREKPLKFTSQIADNLPELVKYDHLRLKQILNNLLNNAVKFTQHGMISLKIDYSLDIDSQLINIQFFIIDTGIGISKENQAKLFQSFSQIDNSNTRKFSGTGLGLAISARLIALMGGELKVDSKENEGSRFYFTLKKRYK